MGKSHSKYKLKNIISFEEVFNKLDIISNDILFEIGESIASTDYAVYYFNNKKHPQYYKNVDGLKHAVRKSLSIGAFNNREKTIDLLYRNDIIDLTQEQYKSLCERL